MRYCDNCDTAQATHRIEIVIDLLTWATAGTKRKVVCLWLCEACKHTLSHDVLARDPDLQRRVAKRLCAPIEHTYPAPIAVTG